MSYTSRGPGRPQQPKAPASASNRTAQDRMAREKERRQRVKSRDDSAPVQPSRILSQHLSPRSQFSMDEENRAPRRQWQDSQPIQVVRPSIPEMEGNNVRPLLPELASNGTGFDYTRPTPHVSQLNVPTVSNSARQLKTFSQASDTSLGSIPDFPVAVNTNGLQVPQPSNRRGYSSYYSQYSNNVAPILEESVAGSRGSVRSYASSNVIPANISNIPDIFYEDADASDGDESNSSMRVSPVPMRTASIGRRAGKAAVTAIRSSRSTKDRESKQIISSTSEEALVTKESTLQPEPLPVRPQSNVMGRQPGAFRSSKQLSALLNDLEREALALSDRLSNNSTPTSLKQTQRSQLAERVGSKVPARLDVEAVRDAEARGSLTSLPELIKRATKLAANLDRGKTASRLGMEWMTNQNGTLELNKDSGSGAGADLEKDGNNTEVDDSMQTGTTLRDSEHRNAGRSSRQDRKKRGRHAVAKSKNKRRCCGMDRKYFIITLVILFLLIAAAVVIPVVLIVLPRLKATNASSGGSCSSRLACQNGGVSSTLPSGTCICLCSNGYSGNICDNAPDAACTTINASFDGKATVGTLIPPLITAANQDFSIPLMDETLLVQFAKFNLTCPVSNALVTFPAINFKRSVSLLDASPLKARQVGTTAGAPVGPTATITVAEAAAATPTANLKPSQVTISSFNSTAVNFARVGILFVLQDSQSLVVTQAAQQSIYSILLSAHLNHTELGTAPVTVADATNITLGSGYVMNLWDWTLTLKNGSVYGKPVEKASVSSASVRL